MKSLSKQIVSTLFIACALAGTGATQAASVTLTGWAYGEGQSVRTSVANAHVGSFSYNGQGGAFRGSLTGTDGFDIDEFIAYCIEFTENFSFSSNAMTNYRAVEGSSCFSTRLGDAGIAERLGRLMTWVAGDATRVSNAAQSTSLQLAIWNTIYDTDSSLTTRSGSLSDSSGAASYANTLLAGAASVQRSRFQVFALERSGKQDFLLLRQQVPEPATLGLVALAGLGAPSSSPGLNTRLMDTGPVHRRAAGRLQRGRRTTCRAAAPSRANRPRLKNS